MIETKSIQNENLRAASPFTLNKITAKHALRKRDENKNSSRKVELGQGNFAHGVCIRHRARRLLQIWWPWNKLLCISHANPTVFHVLHNSCFVLFIFFTIHIVRYLDEYWKRVWEHWNWFSIFYTWNCIRMDGQIGIGYNVFAVLHIIVCATHT